MEYERGYVYELMDQGGPTDTREPYFREAVDEMMRARTLCAKANAAMPDDPSYVSYLEELFGRKLDDVRILTPFICDFGRKRHHGSCRKGGQLAGGAQFLRIFDRSVS